MKTLDEHNKPDSKVPEKISVSATQKIPAVFISTLFGVAHFMTQKFSENADGTNKLALIPKGILAFCFGLLIAYFLVRWYQKHGNIVTIRLSSGKLFIICFTIFFVVGVFWLLVYYPGVGMYDTIAILKDDLRMAQQHPWFYCLIIRYLVRTVLFFGGDYEYALVAESMLQIIVSGLIYSHCIVWLKNKGLGRIPLLVIILFFALDPMLNLYRISLFKDIPFSLLLVEWLILLYDLWESQGKSLNHKDTIFKFVFCIIMSLLRNNGIYVAGFILLCMLICYRKQWRRIIALIGILAFITMGSIWFEKAHYITPLFKETVGIPLQQIAAVVSRDGKMNEEQKEFIDKVIPVDFIKEKYNPYSADSLKWGGSPIDSKFLNTHKSEFLKVWAQMMIPNFKIYTKAYFQSTYGFWATNATKIDRYFSIYVAAFDEWFETNDVAIQTVFPEKLQNELVCITHNSVRAMGEGQLFWLFSFNMILLSMLKDRKIWIVGAPSLGGWLTIMVSTPVAHQWRYILFLPLSIPLLFGILLLRSNGQEQSMERKQSDSDICGPYQEFLDKELKQQPSEEVFFSLIYTNDVPYRS